MTQEIKLGSVQIGSRWYIATLHFGEGEGISAKPAESEVRALNSTMQTLVNTIIAQQGVMPTGAFTLDREGIHEKGMPVRPLTSRVQNIWDANMDLITARILRIGEELLREQNEHNGN